MTYFAVANKIKLIRSLRVFSLIFACLNRGLDSTNGKFLNFLASYRYKLKLYI